MTRNDKRLLLLVGGAALIAGGHKLMDAELGALGVPHAVGAALVAFAFNS